MKRFEINLSRDLVLPARKRRLIYRAMLIYLLLSGGALAVVGGRAASDIRQALVHRYRTRQIRQQFLRQHPEAASMPPYAGRLRAQIEEYTKQAEAIRESLPFGIYTVVPLLNALVSQRDGSTLHRVTFVQESGKRPVLEFGIAVPAQGRKSPIPVFLQTWQKNPDLSKQIATITPTTTLREEKGSEEVFIMNYRALFKE